MQYTKGLDCLLFIHENLPNFTKSTYIVHATCASSYAFVSRRNRNCGYTLLSKIELTEIESPDEVAHFCLDILFTRLYIQHKHFVIQACIIFLSVARPRHVLRKLKTN